MCGAETTCTDHYELFDYMVNLGCIHNNAKIILKWIVTPSPLAF